MALIVLTAVGASIGTPATSDVGIVILAMVLGSVGIPPAGIALIMGVDRILDMSRTAINVSGDLVATVLMDRWVGDKRSADLGPDMRASGAPRPIARRRVIPCDGSGPGCPPDAAARSLRVGRARAQRPAS